MELMVTKLTFIIFIAGGTNSKSDGSDDQCYCRDKFTEYQGACLRYIDEPRGYLDACGHCANLAGDLVNAVDKNLSAILQDPSVTEYWIGLDDIGQEGQFRWKDNNHIHDSKSEFRSFNDDDLDCVGIDASGRFQFLACGERHSFVCDLSVCQGQRFQEDRCSCYTASHTGLPINGDRCFLRIEMNSIGSFQEANGVCSGIAATVNGSNGSLPKLDPWNRVKNGLLTNASLFADTKYMWVGISDIEKEGELRWSADGTSVIHNEGFGDFDATNTDNLDCISISRGTLKWEFSNCFTSLPFICETDLICDRPDSNTTVYVLVAVTVVLVLVTVCVGSYAVYLRKMKGGRENPSDGNNFVHTVSNSLPEYDDAISSRPPLEGKENPVYIEPVPTTNEQETSLQKYESKIMKSQPTRGKIPRNEIDDRPPLPLPSEIKPEKATYTNSKPIHFASGVYH